MSGDNSPRLARRVGRAFRRSCPLCGDAAFDSYFTMKESCDRCGLKFEREPGYWVGATIINTTVIFATFLIVFLVGIVATWPDVPWVRLLVALAIVNIVIPIAFYPVSKTLWSALEMGWNPIGPDDTGVVEDPGRLQGR